MVKKSVAIFALAFIFILISAVMAGTAMAQETEAGMVTKAYDWLSTKVKTRALWESLDIEEHAFALLALSCNNSYVEVGNKSLNNKSWRGPPTIGTCWGEQSATIENECLITETALAKLAADELNLFDTNQISMWLVDQKIFFKNLYWFLELDIERDLNASCMIIYEGGNTTININENKTLEINRTSVGGCFYDPPYEEYWLRIKEDCYEKSFKIRCDVSDETKPFRITLHYRKSLNIAEPWYTSTKSQLIESGKWSEDIVLQSYCLSNPTETGCDYEGTAWAAYALKENGEEEYAEFIPYLVIVEENYKKYLPEALLYLIGIERYGSDVEQLQNPPGFWKAENTIHGQFYDTALVGLTKLGNLLSIEGGARYYLTYECDRTRTFKETLDKKYRYWKCTELGCGDIRDTAFLLWVFWPEFCSRAVTDCSAAGYVCKDACIGNDIPIPSLDATCPINQVCCMFAGVFACEDRGGACKTWCDDDEFEFENISCDSVWDVCCKKYVDATSCNEFGAECGDDYNCSVDEIIISTGESCCPGECIPLNASDKLCSEIWGEECVEGQICMDEYVWEQIPFTLTMDTNTCCVGQCIEDRTCSEVGTVCETYEECSVSTVGTTDQKECCPGTCTTTRTCAQLGGTACEPPAKCSVNTILAYDTNYCCTETCKKRSLWWIWLLILVVIAAGVLLYLYYFKPKQKKKKPKPPFGIGMPPTRPQRPLIPIRRVPPIARPMPSQPPLTRPIPKPLKPVAKGKTEAELERTLKKLKGMAKK